jgi:YHS domain-containing protein
MKILFSLLTIVLFACNSQQQDGPGHVHILPDTTTTMTPAANAEKLYAGVKFDNKYDLSCGMPLTAGVADTAHYKGKVYGFCSAECKEDFKKNADSLVLKAK